MEGSAHAQLHASPLEQVAPDVAHEDGIPVADNGRRKAVEPNNVVEEGLSDGRRQVGVAERYEVRILRKTVDHREDDALALHLGEPFNEVQ